MLFLLFSNLAEEGKIFNDSDSFSFWGFRGADDAEVSVMKQSWLSVFGTC